ncbi:predicted protein [Plenodomus lingam JN3]|uniref:Predicted protein n=2 Tax=Leptosphaeria maculans TaxID=5022 RepID=E4ZRG7_LEPMJ|nr:predicted protein [Plenodomus lingam JN3]CBX93814.1 predicted protein [Plenodomus lingam JN3]
MFFQLLYIHLFRPFLKYNPNNSPLPSHVSPRKLCTQAAAMISKLLRLYKRSHGLRQICNICVYIAHSACTIHLLNLPEKNAKRDIIHGVKHLEEIAEGWLCARRTLGILSVLAKRWNVELPEEAAAVLLRTDQKFGPWNEITTPKANREAAPLLDQQASPTDHASPSLQPYSMNLANMTSPQFFSQSGPNSGASLGTDSFTRSCDTHSLPPSDENALAYRRSQHHSATPQTSAMTPATPASTHGRQSVDGGTTAGNSPSQLFGGVDQLLREGQDWIYRDQTQLASGFENWNPQSIDDIASWSTSTASLANRYPVSGNSVDVNGGGPVGGSLDGFPAMSGNLNLNGVSGINGMGIPPGFPYDERTWYEYQ